MPEGESQTAVKKKEKKQTSLLTFNVKKKPSIQPENKGTKVQLPLRTMQSPKVQVPSLQPKEESPKKQPPNLQPKYQRLTPLKRRHVRQQQSP